LRSIARAEAAGAVSSSGSRRRRHRRCHRRRRRRRRSRRRTGCVCVAPPHPTVESARGYRGAPGTREESARFGFGFSPPPPPSAAARDSRRSRLSRHRSPVTNVKFPRGPLPCSPPTHARRPNNEPGAGAANTSTGTGHHSSSRTHICRTPGACSQPRTPRTSSASSSRQPRKGNWQRRSPDSVSRRDARPWRCRHPWRSISLGCDDQGQIPDQRTRGARIPQARGFSPHVLPSSKSDQEPLASLCRRLPPLCREPP
jgi:hypothetical protein